MTQRIQVVVLGLLLAVLAGTAFNFYRNRYSSPGDSPQPVSLDARFTPLNVDNPALRLDILKRFLALEYKGVHRSIFSATLPRAPGASAVQGASSCRSRSSSGPASPDGGRQILSDSSAILAATTAGRSSRRPITRTSLSRAKETPSWGGSASFASRIPPPMWKRFRLAGTPR